MNPRLYPEDKKQTRLQGVRSSQLKKACGAQAKVGTSQLRPSLLFK